MSVQRTLPVAALLAVLAAGIWLAVEFLSSSRPNSEPLEEPERGANRSRADDPSLAPEVLAGERSEVALPPPVAPVEMPTSYRQSLGVLTGRILEADLQPSVDLPVSILEMLPTQWLVEPAALLAGGEDLSPELEAASTRTDEEGRFRLEGLEPAAVHILGIDLGGPRNSPRIVDQSPRPGEVVDLGDIVLEPYVTFIGRVIDESGDPVPGARVRATDLPFASVPFQFGVADLRRGSSFFVEIPEQFAAQIGVAGPGGDPGGRGPGADFARMLGPDRRLLLDIPPVFWKAERLLPIPTTVSDDNGDYRLEGIPQGLITLFADKAGLQSAMLSNQPSGRRPERKVRDLVLRQGAVLEGVVLDPEGYGVPGLDVRAGIVPDAMSGIPVTALMMQPAGKTDSQGRFRLSGLMDGPTAFVALRRKLGQPWSKHGPFPDHAQLLRIEMGTPAQLRVQLLDPDGETVPEAELYVSPSMMVPGIPPILAPPLQKLNDVERLEDGRILVRGLELGPYRLVAKAPGLALAELDVQIDTEAADCTIQFERGHFLDVAVLRAGDDEPLSWSFVTIAPQGIFESPIDRTRTDDDGRARLEGMTAGSYTITVQHPSRASHTMDVEIPRDELVILLEEGGSLRGRVHENGVPPEQSLFVIATPRGRADPTVTPSFSATTPEGEFYIPNLRVGEYRYEIRDRIVGKGPVSLFMTMRDDPLADGRAEIVEGQTTELDIDLGDTIEGPRGSLRGEVWINGRPAADVTVSAEGGMRRSADTDESGYFEIGDFPAGEGRVMVQKVGSSLMSMASNLYSERFDLGEGENRYFTIELRTASVSGRVQTVDSLMAGTGTMIILRRTDSDSTQMQMANPLTGTFNFDEVPMGDYELAARKQGYASWSTPLMVEGNVRQDVELQLPASVSGIVVLPDGVQLAEAPRDESEGRRRRSRPPFLRLEGEGGSGGNARVDRDTGAFEVREGRPGTYRATMNIDGLEYRSEPFVVPPEGAQGLVLPLSTEKPRAEEDSGA